MFEIIFHLFQSVPLWTAIVLLASIGLFIYLYQRRGPSWSKQKKALLVVIAIAALYSLMFTNIHVTAITNSGPTSGVVVDAVTGKPVAGARVMIVWYTVGSPQASGPMPLVLWLEPKLRCKAATNAYITDASGTYSFPWLGFKTWQGCANAMLSIRADGYDPLHFPNYEQNMRGDRAATPFSSHRWQLTPLKSALNDNQSKR